MIFKNISKTKRKRFIIKEPGKHIFFFTNRSGNLEVDIRVRSAQVYIFGLYIGKKGDRFKLSTIQRHRVGESISDLLIKGVFFDDAKFEYEGLIRIEKDAQKSNAYQKNENLLMSDEVFIDSRPFLEILANDVRCTHGSTTGQLNRDQLFYAKARGVEDRKAQRMLTEGFILDVFRRMEDLGEKKQIEKYYKYLTNWLNE